MKALSQKLTLMFDGVTYYCPGCKQLHTVWTRNHKRDNGPIWEWNNDVNKPTFSPSVLVTYGSSGKKCHCFVRDGMIQYLSDCTHELAGKTVELPDLPQWVLDDHVMDPESE